MAGNRLAADWQLKDSRIGGENRVSCNYMDLMCNLYFLVPAFAKSGIK